MERLVSCVSGGWWMACNLWAYPRIAVLVYDDSHEQSSVRNARNSIGDELKYLGHIITSKSANLHNDKEVSHFQCIGSVVLVPDQLLEGDPPNGWTPALRWWIATSSGRDIGRYSGRWETDEAKELLNRIEYLYSHASTKQYADAVVQPILFDGAYYNVVGVIRLRSDANFTFNSLTVTVPYCSYDFGPLDTTAVIKIQQVSRYAVLVRFTGGSWTGTQSRVIILCNLLNQLELTLATLQVNVPDTVRASYEEYLGTPYVESITPVRGIHYDTVTYKIHDRKKTKVFRLYPWLGMVIDDQIQAYTSYRAGVHMQFVQLTYTNARLNLCDVASDHAFQAWNGLARTLVDDNLRQLLSEQTYENLRYVAVNSVAFIHDLVTIKELIAPLLELKRKIRSPEAWANVWLTYRYGIRLMIMDIRDIVKGWKRGSNNFRSGHLLGRGRSQLIPEGSVMVNGVACHLAFHQKVYYEVSNDFFRRIAQVARVVDLWPSTVNLWDFIPYSFVVDWFFKIGDILANLDKHTDMEIFPIESVLYSAKCVEEEFFSFTKPGCSGTVRRSSYERWVETHLALDTSTEIQTGTPNAIQCVDGLALVIQRQRSINRALRRARRAYRRARRSRR